AGYDCVLAGGGACGLELFDDGREGVRAPGQGVEHLEIEVLVGGTESDEHDPQSRHARRPSRRAWERLPDSCAQWSVMTQNPMSEPTFADSASDRSRQIGRAHV